jgi:hypothetical protein
MSTKAWIVVLFLTSPFTYAMLIYVVLAAAEACLRSKP